MAKSDWVEGLVGILGAAAIVGLAVAAAPAVAAAEAEAAAQREAEAAERRRLAKEADKAAAAGDYRKAAALRGLAGDSTPVGDRVARARELRDMAATAKTENRYYAARQLEEQAAKLLQG